MGDIKNGDSAAFIAKWTGVTASELSTSQSFLSDLCRFLDVEIPHATAEQDYMFERPITFAHGDGSTSAGRIDLYRRTAFVLESKKLKAASHTKGFDDAMLRARSQAENYARALPANEGRPPFVVVVDVGNRIELYAEFSRSGATYTPFPDPRSHRIALADLAKPEIQDRLRRIWLDPLSLDPSRESARVTRDIAARLAELAKSLELAGHAPEAVAQFLMRCLFTMFSEDVKLLPSNSFRDLLAKYVDQPDVAMRMLAQLWRDMDSGGFSAAIANDVLHFNGKLFKQPDTLPLNKEQLQLLIVAATADWQHVEPAIFGTLLERALSVSDRHKLGAHYTPRAYVERLVLPTIIEPLRAEWNDALAAALVKTAEANDIEEQIRKLPARSKQEKGLKVELREAQEDALASLKNFHHRLCTVRVLDPACGSGNFLYVTLEHLKRLEGEVLNALDELGFRQTGLALGGERADALGGETVDPHNLLGIELNPRAAAIAEVVLWIGYLQWHFRTRGDINPPTPVIRDFRNIENRDAVLAYERMEFVTDQHGVPVTRWNGETKKISPVTGEKIPDETARIPLERYINPQKSEWPEADFVVGNPPFIGASTMRSSLGDGYVDALRNTWPEVPESADLVMYWWYHAGQLTRQAKLQRFGLITTNSIKQTFNRRVIENAFLPAAKPINERPISIAFAIPDHPWVDVTEGAAVRISMTVAEQSRAGQAGLMRAGDPIAGPTIGRLVTVTRETTSHEDEIDVEVSELQGVVHADLRVGANVVDANALIANKNISNRGFCLFGAGFIVTKDQAAQLGLGKKEELDKHIRPYRNGRDLTNAPRGVLVVDLYGLNSDEVRIKFPDVYQHVLERVKPERDTNKRESRKRNWWLFGEPNPKIRLQLKGLPRYIATVETAKHRTFQFLDAEIAPDNMLIAIALDDAVWLGVLSSQIHVVWALSAGGRLGVGNDPRYNKTRCFEPFPFPVANNEQLSRIRDLAEQLDTHRKRQQSANSELTLTGMYNVLDKLRSGEMLTDKERKIHEQGLISILRELHDEIDAAALQAYGWSDLLPLLRIAHGNDSSATTTQADAKRSFDEAILERLVELNAERASEEARGVIRWLRPEFQNPSTQVAPEQSGLYTEEDDEAEVVESKSIAATKAIPWPKSTVDQVRAVADILAASTIPMSIDDVANLFSGRGKWRVRLPQLLDMLVALGRAYEHNGQFLNLR